MHWLVGTERVNVCVQRVTRLGLADRRIDRLRATLVAELRVHARMPRIAVVRVHDVARSAARVPIVAGLIVGADEPRVRVVQARLGDVDDRHRDARAGTGPAIGLTEIRPARLLDPLQLAGRVRQAGLREQIADVASAALEHAEDVAGLERLPGRQRVELRQDARDRGGVDQLLRDLRSLQQDRLAVTAVRFAEDVLLEVEDAVVVRGAAPEHRDGRMQAAHGRLDDLHVARAAGFASRRGSRTD